MTDSRDEEEALSFDSIEKDIYVEPPNLPDNTPDELKAIVWQEWQKKDAAKRRAHKAAFTRKQKQVAPDYAFQVSTFKHGGVHRQKLGNIAIDGEENNIEHLLIEQATQDRYFQPRGRRSGSRSRNKKRKRTRNKITKTQRILNSRSKK